MSLDEIVRSSVSRAGVIRVRNALNPLLWLSGVGPALSCVAAYLLGDIHWLRDTVAIVGVLPIPATLVAYFIWMFKDPDRLQSEEFILRQQELSIMERKGRSADKLPGRVETPDDALPNEQPPRGIPG